MERVGRPRLVEGAPGVLSGTPFTEGAQLWPGAACADSADLHLCGYFCIKAGKSYPPAGLRWPRSVSLNKAMPFRTAAVPGEKGRGCPQLLQDPASLQLLSVTQAGACPELTGGSLTMCPFRGV